jgi:hypothetical protein
MPTSTPPEKYFVEIGIENTFHKQAYSFSGLA